MLKNHEPYHDPGATYYEQRYRERKLRNLLRQAKQFGLRLEPVSPSPVT